MKKSSYWIKAHFNEDPGGGNGNLVQDSCPENSLDRGAWRATVHGVAKNWAQLSN